MHDPTTGLISHVGANPSGSSNVSFDYGFDAIGNLVKRVDNVEGYTERFCYDALNRLTSYALTASTSCPLTGSGATTVGYDEIGDIVSKSDVADGATYSYGAGGAGPHAVTSIAGPHAVWPGVVNPTFNYGIRGGLQCIYTGASCTGSSIFRQFSYTSFNMVAAIVQNSATLGNVSLAYAYDDARARFRQVQTLGSDTQTTLYFNFGGLMSEQVTDSAAGTVTTNDYFTVDGEIVGEHTFVSGNAANYYFVNDSLGSVALVANGSGTIQERDSYDAWGLRRNLDGSPASTPCSLVGGGTTTRGYTNQEMVDSACLVNLNARFYDPLIARMPQADSVVDDAYNLQSLNRYSYVNNGPLSATDPSGNLSEGELTTDPLQFEGQFGPSAGIELWMGPDQGPIQEDQPAQGMTPTAQSGAGAAVTNGNSTAVASGSSNLSNAADQTVQAPGGQSVGLQTGLTALVDNSVGNGIAQGYGQDNQTVAAQADDQAGGSPDNGPYGPVEKVVVTAPAHRGTNNESASEGEFIPAAYNGKFHDQVVNGIADAFHSAGKAVITEVNLSAIQSKVTARADLIVEGPDGKPEIVEVKTGDDPSFTKAQLYIYTLSQVPEHVFSTDPKIAVMGYTPGELLPAMQVTIVTQKDASSPMIFQPFAPMIH